MYVLLHNRLKVKLYNLYKLRNCIKVYKTFHFSSIFCWSPRQNSFKNEVTQKGGRDGGSNKSVTRFRTFLEVSRRFENTKNSLFKGDLMQQQCASFCAPFHNRNKQPQPHKTEAATKNFSLVQLLCIMINIVKNICEGKFMN